MEQKTVGFVHQKNYVILMSIAIQLTLHLSHNIVSLNDHSKCQHTYSFISAYRGNSTHLGKVLDPVV